MATVQERRTNLTLLLERIIKETKSSYEDDFEVNNPNPVALIEKWARQVKHDLGFDSLQGFHPILQDELLSRILHSKLDDFGRAIHSDYKYGGAFKERRRNESYVLLAEWEAQNLIKGVEFISKRQELVRMVRIQLAEVELKGLQVDLLWEMIRSWKSMAEKVFLTQCSVEDWDGSYSTGMTVVNVKTEQEYGHLDTELTKFIGAIVKVSESRFKLTLPPC